METLLGLDAAVLLWIQEHLRFDGITPFWKWITSLGNAGWFWIVLAAVLFSLPKTRRVGVTAAVSLLLGFLLTNLLLKNLVARTRPFDAFAAILPLIPPPSDFSFPSGHTCASFASALVYYRLLPKKYGVPLLVLAVLIAFSRLYLGVHYPSDVLGGFLIGLFCSGCAFRFTAAYRAKKDDGRF